MNQNASWQERIDAVWANASLNNAEVIDRIDALAAERSDDDALALFERAGARDSAGLEAQAEPLYRLALKNGLPESQRAQAVIQLGSTLRVLGRADEAVEVLQAEIDDNPASEHRSAAAAFLALALVSKGEPVEATRQALLALVPYLTRYQRSVGSYAAALKDDQPTRG